MTTPEESDGELNAEYTDPFEDMEFTAYDPSEATEVPLGTPLGEGRETEPEPLKLFDDRYKADFEGLAFIGALEARFSFIGHKFHIRTLTSLEHMACAKIVKEYEGTLADNRAYATALVAMSVVSVDGIGLPTPIGETDIDLAWAYERFNYVAARWFPFTVDYVYNAHLRLEQRVRDVLAEMDIQAKKG